MNEFLILHPVAIRAVNTLTLTSSLFRSVSKKKDSQKKNQAIIINLMMKLFVYLMRQQMGQKYLSVFRCFGEKISGCLIPWNALQFCRALLQCCHLFICVQHFEKKVDFCTLYGLGSGSFCFASFKTCSNNTFIGTPIINCERCAEIYCNSDDVHWMDIALIFYALESNSWPHSITLSGIRTFSHWIFSNFCNGHAPTKSYTYNSQWLLTLDFSDHRLHFFPYCFFSACSLSLSRSLLLLFNHNHKHIQQIKCWKLNVHLNWSVLAHRVFKFFK